jgi:hypothetical protein
MRDQTKGYGDKKTAARVLRQTRADGEVGQGPTKKFGCK